MMAILAAAVFLAFLSVFIRDKTDKKRIQNKAHKGNKGGNGLFGMALGGVGAVILDFSEDSEDDNSDAGADDHVDQGPQLPMFRSVALAATLSARTLLRTRQVEQGQQAAATATDFEPNDPTSGSGGQDTIETSDSPIVC